MEHRNITRDKDNKIRGKRTREIRRARKKIEKKNNNRINKKREKGGVKEINEENERKKVKKSGIKK